MPYPRKLLRDVFPIDLTRPNPDTGRDMIKIEEFRPHFLLFEQYLEQWLVEQPDQETYKIHCGQFQRFLSRLQERIRWEYPLIRHREEAHAAFQKINGVVLSKAQHLLGEPQPTHELKRTLREISAAVETIRDQQETLPKFTEARIVNEILVLISHADSSYSQPAPLRERVPSALRWVGDAEMGWNLFARQFPGASSVYNSARQSLEALRATLTALQETSGFEEAESLGRLLQEEVETLADLDAARLELEQSSTGWDGDLHLMRARRENESTAIVSAEAVSELHRYFSNRTRTLANLRVQLRGGSAREERVEKIEKLSKEFTQLRSAWQSASTETPPNPETVSILLSLCANWETSFARLSHRISAAS